MPVDVPAGATIAGGRWRLFDERDRQALQRRGVGLDEAQRQLELLRRGTGFAQLERPCSVGDGLQILDPAEQESVLAAWRESADAGRCSKFVPASGAATRMFEDLSAARSEARAAVSVATFLEGLDRLALRHELGRELARRGRDLETLRRAGDLRPILDALLDPDGLEIAARPKALLPFHDYSDGPRTALEEHLVEAAGMARDAGGIARLHVTISTEQRDAFRRHLEQVRRGHERRLDTRFEVSCSVQSPATDTVALDGAGEPFRTSDGALLFRAAGHGALLANLEGAGDLVLIKNVDNVAPDARKEPTLRWSRLLLGRLAVIQRQVFDLLDRLDAGDPAAPAAAVALLEGVFRRRAPAGAAIRELLDRPIRVCGMVPNEGEPGGGPFWVRGAGGTADLQIVEWSQVDPGSREQRARFAAGSHFNPVFLACALRDRGGRPYPLGRWVDPATSLCTEKSLHGRPLRALERPGLWNGGMAGWNTVFVEVPGTVFTPVKTVLDLLRPEHLPAG